jgi:hypothetical protein
LPAAAGSHEFATPLPFLLCAQPAVTSGSFPFLSDTFKHKK